MTVERTLNDAERKILATLHLTYALHAAGMVGAAIGAATVIGSFLFGFPSIVAVVIAYLRRNDARGSWLHSHFEWQIRTFWFALAVSLAIVVAGLALLIVYVGFAILLFGFLGVTAWAMYRVAKGWWRLSQRRAAYAGFD
jgi:uncharacterized membrane protein